MLHSILLGEALGSMTLALFSCGVVAVISLIACSNYLVGTGQVLH
jgi:hypothetical protein